MPSKMLLAAHTRAFNSTGPVKTHRWIKFHMWRDGQKPTAREAAHPIFLLASEEHVCPYAQVAVNAGRVPDLGQVRAFCTPTTLKQKSCTCVQCKALILTHTELKMSLRDSWKYMHRKYTHDEPVLAAEDVDDHLGDAMLIEHRRRAAGRTAHRPPRSRRHHDGTPQRTPTSLHNRLGRTAHRPPYVRTAPRRDAVGRPFAALPPRHPPA